jgi:CRP-like cAMP-binding protein
VRCLSARDSLAAASTWFLTGCSGSIATGNGWPNTGPGALLGERAHLEGGARTSTLVAVTPCRVVSAEASQFDQSALMELSRGHRREDAHEG